MMLCAMTRIGSHGIDGDESAFKIDAFWKRQNGGDFVGFFVDCLLTQHQPAGCAGLDVSVNETSVCTVRVLRKPAYHFKRIGLEAAPLSQWLLSALAEAGLPVLCVETRHMRGSVEGADRQDAATMRAA